MLKRLTSPIENPSDPGDADTPRPPVVAPEHTEDALNSVSIVSGSVWGE